MRTAITPIFTAIVLVSLSATSLAVEVSNVTTGALLFQSNGFENDQVGTAPAVTSAGTWGAENYPNVSTVITGTAGGAPGALSGSNYLQTVRLSSGDAGNPTANFANQSTAGEQIHAEYMMYLPQNNHSVILIMNGSTEYWRGLAWLKEQSFGYYNGSQYVFTPNAYPVNKWFKVEIDYAINALNYQVKLDGVAMPLATTLNGITHPGGGDLAAISIGHNGAGIAYIDSVAQPPPNDACAAATVIPTSGGTFFGTTSFATSDGSADCGNSNGSPDVWYSVTPAITGNLLIDTCGSSLDTVMGVFASCGGAQIACNDTCSGTPCGGTDACLTVPVTGGTTYLIRVAGASAASGAYTLHVATPPPPNDNCANATIVTDGTYTGTTQDATNDGDSTCGWNSSHTPPSPDVWFLYTAAKAGLLHADLCGSDYDTSLSAHSGCPGTQQNELACNDDIIDTGTWCGVGPANLKDSEGSVTVDVTAGQTVYFRIYGWRAAAGNYQFNINLTEVQPPPANDGCANATPIGNGTFTGSTAWATNDGDTTCGNSATSADVWYSYTATCTGVLWAETCGSAYNTVLSVHGACPGTAGNTLACNDDCGSSKTSCLQVPVTAGQTYLIRVAGDGSAKGEFTLTTSCGPPVTKPSLPLVQNFETDAVGLSAGWETAPGLTISPSACSNPPPVQVITTDRSPAGVGTRSLRWLKTAGDGIRTGVARRWNPPTSSTTAVMMVDYDFKIVQHTTLGLTFVVSGFDATGKLNLNVYNVLFNSSTGDLPLGWNYYDNGNWNNFIPISNVNQVIGHWFHYAAVLNVGARTVDLTIIPLDAGGAGGHILGSFQFGPGVNPLDDDVTNYTGVAVLQSGSAATSEVIFDNVKVQIVGQEACNTPWADANGDGSVDMNDFGIFQVCYTGSAHTIPSGCHCMDADHDGGIDLNDFSKFRLCAGGAGVPPTPLCQ